MESFLSTIITASVALIAIVSSFLINRILHLASQVEKINGELKDNYRMLNKTQKISENAEEILGKENADYKHELQDKTIELAKLYKGLNLIAASILLGVVVPLGAFVFIENLPNAIYVKIILASLFILHLILLLWYLFWLLASVVINTGKEIY